MQINLLLKIRRFVIVSFVSSLKRFLPIVFSLLILVALFSFLIKNEEKNLSNVNKGGQIHWFLLDRKSGQEELYYGLSGEKENSRLIKTFAVKTGVPGKSPTPLPSLLGKDYWVLVDEWQETENSETGPYFLQLNIDAPSQWPYGPVPYLECDGQCDWVKPGYFGLHGTGGDPTRLSGQDPGSSGCVRHSDSDITYLYNLLDPKNEEIRYYVQDN